MSEKFSKKKIQSHKMKSLRIFFVSLFYEQAK